MINNIPNEEFIKIRAELDSLPANSQERSQAAIGYLFDYNLPEEVSDENLLKYFFSTSTPQAIWKWLYLLERSIPYYSERQPEWQKRLLYFPATYIFEKHLLGEKFNYNGQEVKLLFSKHSGDHDNLHTGPNKKDAPDYYIWVDENYIFVDYKFASVARFTSIEQVAEYYADGKHMHNAKLLLSFLEAENKFYLIDYINNEFYPLDILPPTNYITTSDIENYSDPLARLDSDQEELF